MIKEKIIKKKYFVYILKCADKTLYTGITVDLEKRLFEHNSKNGKGAKYTRYRQPVEIVYQKKVKNKSEALKEEHRIRQLIRKEKEDLILKNS